jgi:hypothetical protein
MLHIDEVLEQAHRTRIIALFYISRNSTQDITIDYVHKREYNERYIQHTEARYCYPVPSDELRGSVVSQ